MAQFNTSQWNGSGGGAAIEVTASSLIYGALRLLTVLRAGQAANADTLADALSTLNELIDLWNSERLAIYCIVRNPLPLSAGAREYSIDWPKIEGAGMVDPDGNETPVDILPLSRYVRADKVNPGIPQEVYSDGGFPTVVLSVSPPPDQDGWQLALYQWQPLEGFTELETAYSFPPGYALALKYGLAVELAPMFTMQSKGAVLLDAIQRKAVEYKGKIKSRNIKPLEMRCDDALLADVSINWRTGR